MGISLNPTNYANYSVSEVQKKNYYNFQQDQVEKTSQADSLSISQDALSYLSSTQNATILASGNYSNTPQSEQLSTEQMSSFLTRMIEKISATDLEGKTTNQGAQKISSLKDTLSGVDLTTASSEDIQSIFTSVMDKLKEARPDRSSLISEVSTNSLSSDQNNTLFATLVSQLTSTEDGLDSNAASLLSSLQEVLSEVSLETMTDDEANALFDTVMDTIHTVGHEGHHVPLHTLIAEEELTIDQKKSILGDLINQLASTDDEVEEATVDEITIL